MIAEISFFYNSYLCLQKKWLHKTNTYMYSLLSHRSIIYTIQMNDICTYLNSFFNVIKKNLLYFFFIFVQTFFLHVILYFLHSLHSSCGGQWLLMSAIRIQPWSSVVMPCGQNTPLVVDGGPVQVHTDMYVSVLTNVLILNNASYEQRACRLSSY